jgi:hypothetical protein
VVTSLLGVWQSAPTLFVDALGAREGPGAARAHRTFQLALATLPAVTLFAGFERLQKAYALVGALFMPALAAALLWCNRRRFVGVHRNRPATVAALWAILLFFAYALTLGIEL